MTVRRYHPVLAVLHWLVAFLILVQLFGGYFVVSRIPNADPAKLGILKIHMLVGMSVFLFMLIRFFVRLFTDHPPPTAEQQHGIGRLRTPIHWLFYVLVLATVGSGWYTGWLISDAYATPGAKLRPDLPDLPSRIFHAWTALVLFLLIILHVAAAIREYATGDRNIFGRMGFGERRG